MNKSRITLIVEAFADAFAKVGQGRWTFLRGVPGTSWATIRWGTPYAASLMIDRAPVLEESGVLMITIQAMRRVEGKPEGFDDSILDEIRRDCAAVLRMVGKTSANGDAILHGFSEGTEEDGFFETSDLFGLGIMGAVIRFRVRF